MALSFSFITRHKKTSIALAIVAIVVIGGVALLMRPSAPQYVTAIAQKGDIHQTVEAVGTVTSEHDLELKFPVGGIVAEVDVQEGDRVHAGDILAKLRAGSLGAAVAIQSAAVDSAQAELQKLEEGMRPEDLAIAQAQVDNKKASLQAAQSALESAKQNLAQAQDQLVTLKQEAQTSLSGQVTTATSTLSSQLVIGQTALSTVRDIITNTAFLDAVLRSQPGQDSTIDIARQSLLSTLQSAQTSATSAADYQTALQVMQTGQAALAKTSTLLDQLFSLLDTLPETSYYTTTIRASLKSSLSAQRSLVQTAQGAIAGALSSLQTASAGYDTRIAAEEAAITTNTGLRDKAQADILTFQTALQAQQADLDSKKAPPREVDLDAARARVRQAEGGLAQAAAAYNDTVLRATVDGTITHVNIKAGEAVPLDAAIALVGDSPFRVEVNVSEVDVPKLVISQSGSINLDAFPNTNYKVRVSEIDTSPTTIQGVNKYRIKLDFLYPHPEFKIGMSGDVTVFTGERKDVIKVPSRAVLTKQSGDKVVRVLADDGKVQEVTVTTGMEGQDGDVEIASGLQGGETIIVLTK